MIEPKEEAPLVIIPIIPMLGVHPVNDTY